MPFEVKIQEIIDNCKLDEKTYIKDSLLKFKKEIGKKAELAFNSLCKNK